MPKKILPLLLTLITSCSPLTPTHTLTGPKNSEHIILLHGLARSPKSMQPLARELNKQGYATLNLGYPSTTKTIPQLSRQTLPTAIQKCQQNGATKIHFIGHSMGAILARYQLAHNPPHNAGKLIQLAPPNQGSEIVDKLGHWKLFKKINGPGGQTLGTTTKAIAKTLPPATHPTLIIAGDRTINPINSFILIPGPDDGKVSITNTKLKGMAQHKILHATHPYIMKNPKTIHHTKTFLKSPKK